MERLNYPNRLLIAALAALSLTAFAFVSGVSSQSAAAEWERAAGGNLSFEVASVRVDNTPVGPNTIHSNIDLSSMPGFAPTGGRFFVSNRDLTTYIFFAYKLTATQIIALNRQLPTWARLSRYDIEARAEGNPTKDQYRLMMQSLLADRFKLALHFEAKPTSVLALVVNKPGKFGPQLRPHDGAVPCAAADESTAVNPATVAGGFAQACGQVAFALGNRAFRLSGRDVSMSLLADYLSSQPMVGLTQPVVNGTGLAGSFDFVLEFTPRDQPPDPANGPPFLEALRDQLGLKLERGHSASIDTPVLDHVEQPGPN